MPSFQYTPKDLDPSLVSSFFISSNSQHGALLQLNTQGSQSVCCRLCKQNKQTITHYFLAVQLQSPSTIH